STGPLSVPLFLAYGLNKGAFLSTEAASSLFLFVSKTLTFRGLGAMPASIFIQVMIVAGSVMAGTSLGKSVVMRMRPSAFRHMLDGLLVISGISMLWTALT